MNKIKIFINVFRTKRDGFYFLLFILMFLWRHTLQGIFQKQILIGLKSKSFFKKQDSHISFPFLIVEFLITVILGILITDNLFFSEKSIRFCKLYSSVSN
ncbi:MAG: hypothetical protein A2Y94_07805 [Caldithrix sp. RBG_13_44_9]|nr:MAG: hypothetical protein A2Y94_07805 [Caldithrix sp. RBG_13_44_9]